MIYAANSLSGNEVLIISDKHRGELDFSPLGYWGIQKTNDPDHKLSLIAEPNQAGYQLKKFDTPFGDKKRIPGQEPKIWHLHEQLAYFMKEKDYIDMFGPLNLHPKVSCFDIEVQTRKGQPPDPKRHPICMIGVHNYEHGIIDENIIIDEGDERATIVKFLKLIELFDPDIVSGYFSVDFDMPFILKRMQILGIPFPAGLHRTKVENLPTKLIPITHPERARRAAVLMKMRGDAPHTITKDKVEENIEKSEKENRAKKEWYEAEISLGFGRVHYDLYVSVKLDAMAVTRIRNRRLKTVAEYYGSKDIFDIPDEDKMDMETMYRERRQEMQTYLHSDLRQTRMLFNIYYTQYAAQAQMICTAFDGIVNSKGRAPFAKMFMGRAFVENKIYPAKQNIVRHDSMFRNLTDDGKFKGAYVDIKKLGRFKDTAKIDFSSMYPSIIITFNISPDTVRYLGTEDLAVASKSQFENRIDKGVIENGYYPILIKKRTKDTLVVSIPDDKVNKYISFEIDTSKPGIIPKKISELLTERDRIRKGEMKEIEKTLKEGDAYKQDGRWKILESMQNNYKIAANSIFGIAGNPHFEVGDLPCAMLITGFGRELSHYLSGYLGDKAIEIDTDGIYTSENVNVEEINQLVTDVLTEKYKWFTIAQKTKVDLELKDTPSLFIGMKTYAMKKISEKDGKKKETVEVKGSAFRGSSKAKFYENILKEVVTATLEWKEPEEIRELVDALTYSDKWKPEDFKLSLSVTKEESEYSYDPTATSTMETIYESEELEPIDDIHARIDRLVRKSLEKAATKIGTNEILATQNLKGVRKFLPTEVSPMLEWMRGSKDILKEAKKNPDDTEKYINQMIKLADDSIGKVGIPSIEKKMPVPIRLLNMAKSEGLSTLKGESIEYYQALGESEIRIFSKENLEKYPINVQWYKERLDKVVKQILEAVSNQNTGAFF